MKALVSVVPGTGHWLPFVPLIRALKRAGHSVTVASSEAMRAEVESEAELMPVGIDAHESKLSTEDAMQMVRHNWPISAATEIQKLAKDSDIVIRGPWDPAAFVAALKENSPRAVLGYAVRRMSVPRIGAMCHPNAFIKGPHHESMQALGVKNTPCNPSSFVGEGDPVIDITPPFLHPAPPEMYGPNVRSFRHNMVTGYQEPNDEDVRATVVCFGTVANKPPWIDEELTKAGIEAQELTPSSPADLVSALDGAGLFVHHGGWGTTVAALYAGVPSIAVPIHADNAINALRLHQSGAGYCAMNQGAFKNAIANFDDCSRRAEELSSELSRLPDIGGAVSWLEEMAGF